MKKSIIMILVLAGILTLSLDSVMANVPYAPDLPALPEDDFLCGDVNEDGTVNVLDIISMVNYILGGSPDPFNLAAADVNADDAINVLDIIAIVNIILETPGIPCPCIPSVDYEGKTYSTVQIDEQCWFRENLNVGTMIMSDQGGQLQTNNGIIEKFCYDNDADNCDTYGGLYEWDEAMNYSTNPEETQGICPPNWHIPSDEEWKILEGTVDSQFPVGDPVWEGTGWRGFDAGSNLKEEGNMHWAPPNDDATNSSGFTALPGGLRSQNDGSFINLGSGTYVRTSTAADPEMAWRRQLASDNPGVDRRSRSKVSGISVRCLKGCVPQPTQADAGLDQLDIPGTSTALAGNFPGNGTGLWEIMSGTGGTIVTPTSPTSEFLGVAGNEYTLSWTITTQCGSSMDEVVISFAEGSTFTCGDDLEYEGQSYATVQIGEQCWMAENLNVGTKINSTQGGFQQTDNGTIEKYCYDNDEVNCAIYGGLYEWPEAMQYVTTEGALGICPPGWHIPTDNQWKILEGTVDSQYPVGDPEWDKTGWRGLDAGGNLKEAGTVHWNPPNTGATNSSGFTGLPGGYRSYDNGGFYYLGYSGFFWSSSQYSAGYAWLRSLYYYYAFVLRFFSYKENGFSVRCLQD